MKGSGQNKSKQKQILNKNLLESLNSIGSQVAGTAIDETKAISEEFFAQLLNRQKTPKASGELAKGQSLEMKKVLSGEEDRNKKLENQMLHERRLHEEDRQEREKKLQELKVRLQAIQQEALKLINSTQSLTSEVRNAVLQGAVNASEYHVSFFESIIQTIVAFRKKIDNAVVWLQGSSKRAEKKNYWSQYKKKGASFLLSPDHYSQRNAG